jgi:type II secretory pathway component PulF
MTKESQAGLKKQFNSLRLFGLGKDRDFFVENFSLLIGSGVSALEAISSIRIQVQSKRFKKILLSIENDVEEGLSLWKAFNNSGLFPSRIVSLIKAGEESGNLSKNLEAVGVQLTKEKEFRSKVFTALLYPSIALITSLVVGLGAAFYLLPQLSSLLASEEANLPLISKVLFSVGIFLEAYGAVALPTIVILILTLLYFLFFFKKTKILGEKILLSLPGLKTFVQEVEVARMGFIVGSLLEAGLSITETLKSLSESTTMKSYQAFYLYIQKQIEDGNSFEKSFKSYPKSGGLVPATIQQMIASGEKSGNLSNVFVKIGNMFESRHKNTSERLTVILEPLMIIFIAVVVFIIALGVLLPIYSLYDAI